MTVRELREKYLAFFESKDHRRFPSGSLIPYDVTGRLDESLLFNGAGMVQFKPYFRGSAKPDHPRLMNCQKCLRTGDIEEVGDDSHLTFFEMLGNFSFGDYFKKDAIDYSWEFMTSKEWLGLDPARLSFTVFEEDDEAFDLWAEKVRSAGFEPETRVFRLSEATNYWPAGSFTKGPPGPCGPNSEMFYWIGSGDPPTGEYSREDYLRDEAEGKWMEIWNDVFIQSDWQGELNDPARPDKGWRKTGMPDLPFQSVDTGMGLDRTATVLGGFSSVYDTDAFQPIFRAIEGLGGDLKYGSSGEVTVAMRIIADHLRAAVFCVADGVLPGNSGRGYVLRRLIRRAVLKGARSLEFDKVFMVELVDTVVSEMGGHYTELQDRSELIKETLKSEEQQFRLTLERGSSMLTTEINRLKSAGDTEISGEFAFQLYDTYGFPSEITSEIGGESGLTVDSVGFRTAMLEAQERSRGASGMDTVYGGSDEGLFGGKQVAATKFVGYDSGLAEAKILAVQPRIDSKGKKTGRYVVALDRSPFYAESGGQSGDTGTISADGQDLKVLDVQKREGVWLHIIESKKDSDPESLVGQTAEASVDLNRRKEVTRNHTATHLLHAALRKVLGEHVTQAGSLVASDHLRFDFTHGKALSAAEISQVEEIVTGEIWAAQEVTIYDALSVDEARSIGAMALFGEKYGSEVRVVQIGGMDKSAPSFSRELCGGIHVANTGEIGPFKVISEASAASGVRRIIAYTGRSAVRWADDQAATVAKAAAKLKANPRELLGAIDKTLEALKEEKRKREKLAQQGTAAETESAQFGDVTLAVQKLTDVEMPDAQRAADRLVDNKPDHVALVTLSANGKVMFVCKAGDAAVKAGVHAGNMVKAAASAAGGGGGGRPNFATAGGRDATKLDEALEAAKSTLACQVG
jgi:alanyl-tRNA synthetase